MYEKAKWCKDSYDYYTCALGHVTNCTATPVITEIAQLTLFMDFVEKLANRECPGGLHGCAVNGHSDMRCRLGAKYFIDKNAVTDNGGVSSLTINSITFFVILLIVFGSFE